MSDPVHRAAGVILAAGEARRFGSQKLLAPLGGRPLLQHAVDAANASGLDPVVVVLGADAEAIERAVAFGRARVARNPAYASGQASSLRAGLGAIEDAGVDALVVLLGDQPRVRPPLLDAILARQRETGSAAVLSSWRGRRSPPALLHRDLWPEVRKLAGDVGARDILAGRADVAVLDVTAELGALDDVDTRADHARLGGRP